MPYTRGTTISEAARLLEIPEHAVRARLADGTIRVVGKGPYGAHLLHHGDVKALARRFQLGLMGRLMRLVLVVGDGLEEQRHALRVSGLEPETAPTILGALERHAKHDIPGAPILVCSPGAVAEQQSVIEGVMGTIHVAVVTMTQTSVSWSVEQHATIVEPDELRRLVQWAWHVLDERTEAGGLKL